MTDNVRKLFGSGGGDDGGDFDAEQVVADASGLTIRENPGNPYDVAQEFVAEWAGLRVSWRGDFYHYTGSHWVMEPRDDVMREVNFSLGNSVYRKVGKDGKSRMVKWSPNNSSLANLENQLHFHASLPSETEPIRGGEFVFLENGRYSLSAGVMLPHDPKIFNLHACPFPYDPDNPQPAPTWDTFITQTFGDDQDSIDRHYLWMATELSGSTDLQKIYYLLGQPRSGKGTLMGISDALLGLPQVTAMSLSDFGQTFGLQALVGKSVCRINDARDAGTATGPAVERLLSIVGGDAVQINRKNRDAWVGTLPVRFTLSSNEVIRLPDASGAIVTRFIFNRTHGSHLGHEDFGLRRRIIENEMPGVLHRVLEYMDRVYEKWPDASSVEDIAVDMRNTSQPLRAWVEDSGLEIVPVNGIAVGAAYHGYKEWSEQNGYRPMNSATFGRSLRAWLPDVTIQRIGPRGEQARYYVGIGYERFEGV